MRLPEVATRFILDITDPRQCQAIDLSTASNRDILHIGVMTLRCWLWVRPKHNTHTQNSRCFIDVYDSLGKYNIVNPPVYNHWNHQNPNDQLTKQYKLKWSHQNSKRVEPSYQNLALNTKCQEVPPKHTNNGQRSHQNFLYNQWRFSDAQQTLSRLPGVD